MERLKKLGSSALVCVAITFLASVTFAETGVLDAAPSPEVDAGDVSSDASDIGTSDGGDAPSGDIGMSDGGDIATSEPGSDVGSGDTLVHDVAHNDGSDAANSADDDDPAADLEDDEGGCSIAGLAATPGSGAALVGLAVLLLGMRRKTERLSL